MATVIQSECAQGEKWKPQHGALGTTKEEPPQLGGYQLQAAEEETFPGL